MAQIYKPSQLILELNYHADKVQSPQKKVIKKLNLKGEYLNQFCEKDIPLKQYSSRRDTQPQSSPFTYLPELVKDVLKSDRLIEKPEYSPNPKPSLNQRKIVQKLGAKTPQKTGSEKSPRLKDEYGILYKRNIKPEEKEDLSKKNQNTNNRTYSIKYYGELDNQFGVASQRIALPSGKDMKKRDSPSPSRFNKTPQKEQKKEHSHKEGSQTSSPYTVIQSQKELNGNQILPEIIAEYNLPKKKKIIHQEKDNKLENLSKEMTSHPFDTSLGEEPNFKLISVSQKTRNSNPELPVYFGALGLNENLDAKTNTRRSPSPGDFIETRAITSYSLPKKMQAIRRPRPKPQETNIEAGLDIFSSNLMRNNSLAEDQIKSRSLSRTKKSIPFLNIPKKKEIDEASVPIKYRPHQAQVLMSSTVRYSYSKLLTTLSRKSKPEEPDEVLAQDLKKAEDMSSLKQSSLQSLDPLKFKIESKREMSPAETHNDGGHDIYNSTKGSTYFKPKRPSNNSLYNTYTKIKKRVNSKVDL